LNLEVASWRLPSLAQMRSADRVQKCLLFEVDRTYRRQVLNDANDRSRCDCRFACLRWQRRGPRQISLDRNGMVSRRPSWGGRRHCSRKCRRSRLDFT
jgi:hypothetical protein